MTIEILAKRRAERRVRRHGTTGARSTRSYRVSKSAPRDAKLTEPLTDTVSTAKDFGGASTSDGTTGPTGPRSYHAREEQPKFQKFYRSINDHRYERRRSVATVPCGRTTMAGRLHVDSTRYERSHPSAIVPCGRTVSATTSSTAGSQV